MSITELKLENEFLSLICLPEYGGKISSIFVKFCEFEILFQNPKNKWQRAYLDANFADFEACGFDDAFPSIDRESFIFNNKQYYYPDHGEIWSSSMNYKKTSTNIKLDFESKILPYTYKKNIHLNGNKIIFSYSINNIGNEDFPAFWTMHGLFNIENDMKIFLPNDTQKILNVMNDFNTPLGECHKIYNYPIDNEYDFTNVVNQQDLNTCSKFYIANPIKNGKCGYIYPSRNLKVTINFNTKDLPYIGFWKTLGAFRGDKNCALEPSAGFYDNIKTALKNKKCPIIKAKDSFNFEITIEIDQLKEK